MKNTNETIVRERGPVRVAWVCLGEGDNRDYTLKNSTGKICL